VFYYCAGGENTFTFSLYSVPKNIQQDPRKKVTMLSSSNVTNIAGRGDAAM
jgi:hypothetical protein